MSGETKVPSRKDRNSGAIQLDGTRITYTSPVYGSFSIPLSEVAVIGEFTTDNGPFIDDWFLVFVLRDGSDWFEASMFAEGIEPLRQQLSETLGASFGGDSLVFSTDFASRIVWPPALVGRPLFAFSPDKGSGVFGRIRLAIFPQIAHHLSSDTLSAIERSA